MTMQTHYEVLGVSEQATLDEIKRVAQRLLLETHPDKQLQQQAQQTQREQTPQQQQQQERPDFERVREAYDVLRDAVSRQQYDRELEEQRRRTYGVINDFIEIDEMDYDEDEKKHSYPCRCGDCYELHDTDMQQRIQVVGCMGCSLSIHVTY